MKIEIKINSLEKYLANLINDIKFKRITEKLKKYDLILDIVNQRAYHFCSFSR